MNQTGLEAQVLEKIKGINPFGVKRSPEPKIWVGLESGGWFWLPVSFWCSTRSLSSPIMSPAPSIISSCALLLLCSAVQVMQVVREQIMRALTAKPNSLDQFKSRLQNLSYTEILKIRQSERMNQEDFQSRPILWVMQSFFCLSFVLFFCINSKLTKACIWQRVILFEVLHQSSQKQQPNALFNMNSSY